MKTSSLAVSAAALAAVLLAGCADRNRDVDTVSSTPDAVTTPGGVTPAGTTPTSPTVGDRTERAVDATKDAAADAWDATKDVARDVGDRISDAAARGWNDVENATWDERASFRTRVAAMDARLDSGLEGLRARTAGLTGEAREGWDKAAAELREARSDLREELDDLGDATAEGWNDAKGEVREAWQRVQRAYADLETRARR